MFTQAYKDGLQHLKFAQFASALDCFDAVIAEDANDYNAELNAGVALCNMARFAEALPYFESSLRKHSSILVNKNLGICLSRLNRYAEAESAYQRALTIDPDDAMINYSMSDVLLAQTRYEEGWQQYDWRKKTALWDDREPYKDVPTWRGESLDDKTVAIFHEQGFGDSVMLARYIPSVQQRVKTVILICPTALHALFHDSFDLPVYTADAAPVVDYQCSLCDLPSLFAISLSNVPSEPYLRADAAQWRDRLQTLPRRPHVGLCWAGGPHRSTTYQLTDTRRSLSFDDIAPFFEASNVNFISLQKGDAIWLSRCSELPLVDWTDELTTFADTAALIANLDVVISVDTAVVHVAGGLGKAVWLLNRFDTCWRWQPMGNNPWYTSVREFRQTAWRDWSAVIGQVSQALRLLGTSA